MVRISAGRCVARVRHQTTWPAPFAGLCRRGDRLMAKRARASQSGPRRGKQPPRYRFFLNPYTDVRFTTCPQCRGKTSQRKLPLVIHIDPMQLVALNKTCRYCPRCDLLIAHQDELEAWLHDFRDVVRFPPPQRWARE